MKTYKMSDSDISKKRILYSLGWSLLVGFLIFMVIDPLLFFADDPMPFGFKIFIVGMVVFASIRVINFLALMSKTYFKIEGTTLTSYKGNKVKQHDIINDYFVLNKVNSTLFFFIILASSTSLIIHSTDGRTKSIYAPISLGKDKFNELIDDINAIRASHQQ